MLCSLIVQSIQQFDLNGSGKSFKFPYLNISLQLNYNANYISNAYIKNLILLDKNTFAKNYISSHKKRAKKKGHKSFN